MAGFDNGVNAPGGVSYAAPLLQFQQFGNWAADDPYAATRKQQEQQLNQQAIQARQQQADIAKTFQGGLPRDAQGNIDYRKAVEMLAQKGDVGAISQLAPQVTQQQSANAPQSPMLTGGAAQPQGGPQPAPGPAIAPANSPKGDAGSGTVTSLVTDRLPNQDATTGQTIIRIADVMGVDPNATLTPGQTRRAQGLLQKYAPADAGGAGADGGSKLPPSANAVSPAPPPAPPAQARPMPAAGAPQPQGNPAPPQPAMPPQPAPIGAPTGGPPAAVAAPQPAQAPQPQQQPAPQPIVPQVPLPKGFTDPQQAILALKQEAARVSRQQGPGPKADAVALNDWAERIEKSIQPREMHAGTTLLDPKTGQPIYSGSQPTLTPDAIQGAAERYLQTGTLPPNMGKGVQGGADRNAIMAAASDLARERGIDQADLPKKWQEFKTQQVAIQRFKSGKQGDTTRSFNVLVDHLDTLTDAAAALKNGDTRLLNRFKQNWAANTGGTAPTNFDGIKALVGDEIVKAVVGSAGALADREEVKKDLDRASSPKQLAELVERYKKLALGQLRGLRKQYESATGLKDFGDLLLPGTLSALGGLEGKGAETTPTGFTWSVVK